MPDGSGVWMFDRRAKPLVHFGSQPEQAEPEETEAKSAPSKWYYDKEAKA